MIDRIVLFKLKDEYANDAARWEVAAYSKDALASVPGVRSVSVGIPADDPSRKSWDLSIVVRFDSLEEVQAYLIHPDHRRYVDDYMRPRMEVVKAWNFELTP
ncbi:MAG: Dabb family protein [Myxococcota bacterium]